MKSFKRSKLQTFALLALLAFATFAGGQKPYDIGNIRIVIDTGDYSFSEVAFLPNREELVTVSARRVIFWNIAEGKEVRDFELPERGAVAISPDKEKIALVSDEKVEILSADTGKSLMSWNRKRFEVHALTFSPDGKTLATGGGAETLILWDVETGTELKSLKHTYADFNSFLFRVFAVAFSPDGRFLASGGNHNTVAIWDVKTGKLLNELKGHDSYVSSVAVSRDGKTIISGDGDGTVKIWDLTTAKELKTLVASMMPAESKPVSPDPEAPPPPSVHQEMKVESIAVSPDGKVFASSQGQDVKLYELRTERELKTLSLVSGKLVFSPDGRILASSIGNALGLREVDSGKVVFDVEGEIEDKRWISNFGISPDGRTFAIGRYYSNSVNLWNMNGVLRAFKGDDSFAFSNDGSIFVYSEEIFDDDGTDKADGDKAKNLRKPDGKKDKDKSEDISKNGENQDAKAAYEELSSALKLVDTKTGKVIKSIETPLYGIDAFVFSPDDKLLVGATSSGKINLWDVESGKLFRAFELLPKYEHSPDLFFAFDPKGKLLAAKGITGALKVWDIQTGKEIRTIKSSYTGSIAFSPDGKTIASSNEDGRVQLWEVATGIKLKPLEGNQYGGSLMFSPDGKRLVNQIGADRRIWNIEIGKDSGYGKVDDWVRLSDERVGWFVTRINGKMIYLEKDGTKINFADINLEKLLATLVFIAEKDWVVTTPDGRFDASEGALGSIHFTDGKNVLGFGANKRRLFKSGLLDEVLGFR